MISTFYLIGILVFPVTMLIVTYFIRLIPEYTNDEMKDIRSATIVNKSRIGNTPWDVGKTTLI